MPFKSIGLTDALVQGILATGYTAPTEIQAKAIPTAIAGKDIIGCAQTGTGKTAAFVLPLLNRLSKNPSSGKHPIRSLILTPTRELAVQIEQSIRDYGRFLKLRTLAVYGGVNINTQLRSLERGVDIIIATPGRLLDHMERRSISLRQVEVLVVDEADRMFDMGFVRDVKRIIQVLPEKRQTLLFSATMSSEVKALAKQIQKSPRLIQIGQQHNPIETITQALIYAEKDCKMDLLLHLLDTTHMYSVLVFSRTKYGADKIRRKLARADISAVAIHSNRTQRQRQSALDGFKAGKFQVMVATDIAARGIDVDGITHVINYDVPGFPEDYVHRIGRTGRATATGDAITFVSNDERKSLRNIETFISSKIPIQKIPDFESLAPVDFSRELTSKAGGSRRKTRGDGGSHKQASARHPLAKSRRKPAAEGMGSPTSASPKSSSATSSTGTHKKKTHVKPTRAKMAKKAVAKGAAAQPWHKRKKKSTQPKSKRPPKNNAR
ncbi:DEAD/DEAH box helicase [Planctomycetota bacterium]